MRERVTNYFVKLFGLNFQEILLQNNRFKIANLSRTKNVFIDSTFSCETDINLNIRDAVKELLIRANVVFRHYCNIYVHENALLRIERNVFFNNYCSINCLGEIVIGEFTMFGESVKIYDHNHLYNFTEEGLLHVEREKFNIGKVIIGKKLLDWQQCHNIK